MAPRAAHAPDVTRTGLISPLWPEARLPGSSVCVKAEGALHSILRNEGGKGYGGDRRGRYRIWNSKKPHWFVLARDKVFFPPRFFSSTKRFLFHTSLRRDSPHPAVRRRCARQQPGMPSRWDDWREESYRPSAERGRAQPVAGKTVEAGRAASGIPGHGEGPVCYTARRRGGGKTRSRA